MQMDEYRYLHLPDLFPVLLGPFTQVMQLEVGMYSFSLSLQLDRGFIILKQTYNIGNIKKKKRSW